MQSNKDLIRQMWEAFTACDRQKFFAVMADEIKFTVMGTTSLSLVTHGREEMIDRVLTPLAAALDGEMTVAIDNIVAEGDWVVMQSRSFGKGKNGQPYNNHYAQVFRVRDGMVVEWIEYLDTAMLARILSE
jgi:ketosteroid isomerase-like protein